MPNGFARSFYMSWGWISCRTAYAESRGWLCERCAARGLIVPGVEVHHKVRLTKANIKDPSVALNWKNLELLCKDCHLKEHDKTIMRTDEFGTLSIEEAIERRNNDKSMRAMRADI